MGVEDKILELILLGLYQICNVLERVVYITHFSLSNKPQLLKGRQIDDELSKLFDFGKHIKADNI